VSLSVCVSLCVCVGVCVYVCICVMSGKSSSDGSDITVTSPVHRLHSDKSQSWSSLFHNKSHHIVSSLSSSSVLTSEHSLPVHASVSRPFKPVGHNPARSTVDGSLQKRPPQTVSSECPLLPTCMSANRSPLSSAECSPHTGSSECPLLSEQTPADSCRQISVSSEDPLMSVPGSSDEEDPTAASRTVDSPLLQCVGERDAAVVSCHPALHTAASTSKLSAAAQISMALSESDSLPKSQSDSNVKHRSPSSQQCYLAPTTKISVALTERTSKIGCRLSTMLRNSRLHQRSSSSAVAGMMC